MTARARPQKVPSFSDWSGRIYRNFLHESGALLESYSPGHALQQAAETLRFCYSFFPAPSITGQLEQMRTFGTNGEHPQNIERDLHAWTRPAVEIKPYSFRVPVKRRISLEVSQLLPAMSLRLRIAVKNPQNVWRLLYFLEFFKTIRDSPDPVHSAREALWETTRAISREAQEGFA